MASRSLQVPAFAARLAMGAIGPLALNPRVPLNVQRRGLDLTARLTRPAAVTTVKRGELAGRPVLTCSTGGDGPVVLHLHGGGFVVGGLDSHAALAAHLAAACHGTVHLLDYRLAPEHPAPAAEQDTVAAARVLIEQHGADQVVLSGDSAGGWLVLVAAAELRDSGLPQPRHLVLLSPWTDLDVENVERPWGDDPVLSRDWLRMAARSYLGERPAPPPVDPTGLAPMTVHVGSREPLRTDALRLVARARVAGTPVRLRVVEKLWHAPHFLAGVVREVDPLITDIAAAITSGVAVANDEPAPRPQAERKEATWTGS